MAGADRSDTLYATTLFKFLVELIYHGVKWRDVTQRVHVFPLPPPLLLPPLLLRPSRLLLLPLPTTSTGGPPRRPPKPAAALPPPIPPPLTPPPHPLMKMMTTTPSQGERRPVCAPGGAPGTRTERRGKAWTRPRGSPPWQTLHLPSICGAAVEAGGRESEPSEREVRPTKGVSGRITFWSDVSGSTAVDRIKK